MLNFDVLWIFSLVLTDSGHPKLYQAHLKTKLTQYGLRAFSTSIQDFFKEKLTKDYCDYFEKLFLSMRTETQPHMVFMNGVAGIGKTLILKKFMLTWSEGLVSQSKFSYIFYFCCQDVKQLKTASLAELISREYEL